MNISITLIIVLITVAASFYAWNNPSIQARWMMNPYGIDKRNQYYRFLTSGFIHADMMHLGFNMFTFFFFGGLIEKIFTIYFGATLGGIYFVMLYVLGIIISDIPSFLKNRNNYQYNALGASGGVSSVIFACILFNPLSPICLYGIFCLPGFVIGVLYLVYSATMSRGQGDNINHDAHLYGALFGILFSIAIMPQVVPSFFRQLGEWKGFF